jgi:hypothetical protein
MALHAESCNANCHFGRMAFMLSVASKLYTLNAIMLSVVMLSVVAPFFNTVAVARTRKSVMAVINIAVFCKLKCLSVS